MSSRGLVVQSLRYLPVNTHLMSRLEHFYSMRSDMDLFYLIYMSIRARDRNNLGDRRLRYSEQ
jgi:hypothetical protein